MNTKRILGFVILPLVAIVGMLLPQGLTGQTEDGAGVVRLGGGPAEQPAATAVSTAMPMYNTYAPPPLMVAPPSVAAAGLPPMQTPNSGPVQVDPGIGFMMTDPTSTHLFGPQVLVDSNFSDGLGYQGEYFRLSALVPWHIVAGESVMLFDGAASVTEDGRDNFTFNGGIIYRNFDQSRNRIFGWNVYYDYERAVNRPGGYQRVGGGIESLGKYFDFRLNTSHIVGDSSYVVSNALTGDCNLVGHNIMVTRQRQIETAFDIVDAEAGGPLPFLGHFGINGFVGAYYVDNDVAGDAVGVSARVEALVNDATTANFTYTNDKQLGSNTFASVSVTMPRWRSRGWFKPRVMQERLGDPVRRNNRVQTKVASYRTQEAAINPLDGQPFELLFVDPNLLVNGSGTVGSPLNSLENLAIRNRARFDIISVAPRGDNTSTNLTIDGGLDLFAGQQLLSRTKTHRIFESGNVICDLPSLVDDPTFLPAITDRSEILDPLITNPSGGAGSYVVSLSDRNVVSGFRIDANGGRGIVSRGRIRDFEITCNQIFNHTDAVVLNNVRGHGIFSDNIINGADTDGIAQSDNGLILSVAANETLTFRADGNTITDHIGDGMDIVAKPGSRLEANDTEGTRTGSAQGIVNNVTNGNDRGIRMEARDDAIINASVIDNEFSENTRDGFLAIADSGRVVFRNFSGNTGQFNGTNGVFFQYRNGGRFYALSEDLDENGVFDTTEDLNGNGVFDVGFARNDLSNNSGAGLCIFGQGSGRGFFDIGGPDPALGNTFISNADAGIAVDLTGTARADINALFNVISSSGGSVTQDDLTFILDFYDLAAQGPVTDLFGFDMSGFDVNAYGFSLAQQPAVEQAILQTVQNHFYGIPTSDVDPRSPIPPGMQLAIDFVIGDHGDLPSNGAQEFYTVFISGTSTPGAPLGFARLNAARNNQGVGPGPGIANGDQIASVYTDNINGLGGLNPPDLDFDYTLPDVPDLSTGGNIGDALISGNIDFTRHAIAGTTSHEIGHNLSLLHLNVAGSVTPTGLPPIMATGAIDLPNQSRIEPREFAFSGANAQAGGATQTHIQQLVDAVGLRVARTAGPSGDGVRIRASNDAQLDRARLLNNEITNLEGDGVSITMNDNAVASDVDIHSNTITGNDGRGVHLEARGDRATIFADRSIGGSGTNTLGGVTYDQANNVSNNIGDGIQVVAAQGGTVYGNIRNNVINANGGNGVALLIEEYGTLDFGDIAENRVVEDNEITNNGGFGILLRSESVPGEVSTAKLITQNNMINNNISGGLFADLTGSNNNPPALASPLVNSTLDLTIVDEIFDANGDVGIAVSTTGNTKANVLIQDTSVTNTTAGTVFGGDGINFNRSGSSLLTAVLGSEDLNGNGILNPGEDINGNGVLDLGGGNIVSNNAGNGMSTTYSGNNRFDLNQPMGGTINSVTFNGNAFESNGGNGVSFLGRGDGQMMGDGMNNIISNNASNGILVDTREFSTFGDPSDGSFLPPGRRTVFKSNLITGNGLDGVQLTSIDNSRQLVQITSDVSSTASDPHNAGLTDGDTVISGNGRDGVRVTSADASDIDVLINSGAGQTVIADNTADGVRFDASGTSPSTVTVQETQITGNGANGIQANFTENTTATLQVGGNGLGNEIQSNTGHGVAVTATGDSTTGTPQPTINVVENTIGGHDGGTPAGNGGDGVVLSVNGGTAAGANAFETGPIVKATYERNELSENGGRGATFEFTGAGGIRVRENIAGIGGPVFDPILVNFNDNIVRQNGGEGVFYQADAGFLENRQVLLANPGAAPFDPSRAEFTNLNLGSVNGTAAYMPEYLNLRTAQNSQFIATGNEIKNNGTGLVTGQGMVIRVSPNAYVAADVQDNRFGGNLNADFFTESFNNAGNPLATIDVAGPAPDIVHLDDTAQLDLRFNNNTGNQINVTADGALYTDNDAGKNFFRTPNNARRADLFQVDGGPFLNSPNNVFSFQGTLQNIRAAFSTGNYFERSISDPLFPNIGFPPPLL